MQIKLASYFHPVMTAVSCLYPANLKQRITRHLCLISLFTQIELLLLFITVK